LNSLDRDSPPHLIPIFDLLPWQIGHFEQTFMVVSYDPADVPPAREIGKELSWHLGGCRISWASDRKVNAVINGEPVNSEEII
jgi:hypothetical protein